MIRSLYTVNRNMNILQKKLENSGGNLSNIKTPGYKFQTIIQETLAGEDMINFQGGNELNRRQDLGKFVFGNQISQVHTNFEMGNLVATEKPTDFAIVGDGFFNVQDANGNVYYTKNGNFKVDREGFLITNEGYNVLDINNNPAHTARDLDLRVTSFNNKAGLVSHGETNFTSQEAGYLDEGSLVRRGFLEMSNINPADEMVDLITISREFETNQKLIRTADETLAKAVNEIGRV